MHDYTKQKHCFLLFSNSYITLFYIFITDFPGGFEDRFPFDNIPPEFRDHFPSHWGRRFVPREEPPPPNQEHTPTQTQEPTQNQTQEPHLPQYGLRNTVDLGQKSPADPSLVDGEDRNQRSMSAPPDNRTNPNCTNKMNQQSQQQNEQPSEQTHTNVRHIPIFVEGRDEPVINKSMDGPHNTEPKHNFTSPNVEREQYFHDEPSFSHPPNFSRPFGSSFNKGFRQNTQPFMQQKVYPQNAFARENSPQRSQSPRPQPQHKVPTHHEQSVPIHVDPTPSKQQQRPQPPQQQQKPHPQQQQKPQPQQQQPQPSEQQSPPEPKPQPASNDPITQILSIQTDVLNLMTEVENFSGAKADKKYMFLDEMLTRNLIKLDNIETDGKENIRQARKEAIKCIQKCIAVLEAKAEKASNAQAAQSDDTKDKPTEPVKENGENAEVEMKDAKDENVVNQNQSETQADNQTQVPETRPDNVTENKETEKEQAQAPNTQPEATNTDDAVANTENKKGPKKGGKTGKKGDKNKEKKDKGQEEKVVNENEKKDEVMQVDEKGENKANENSQNMEVDGAPASQ